LGGSEKSGSRDEPMMRPDEVIETGLKEMVMAGLLRRMAIRMAEGLRMERREKVEIE
jgi:hypothetical protein